MKESSVEISRKPGKPRGLPKSGGRKKGTPNKNTLVLRDDLNSRDFSIADKYIELYYHADTTIDQKLQILQILARYSYPTFKEADATALVQPQDDSDNSEQEIEDTEVLRVLAK